MDKNKAALITNCVLKQKRKKKLLYNCIEQYSHIVQQIILGITQNLKCRLNLNGTTRQISNSTRFRINKESWVQPEKSYEVTQTKKGDWRTLFFEVG